MYSDFIRNVAIIAHVDHGKTTLVNQLLYQSGMFRTEELDKLAGSEHDLIMDSNPIERERGITILSKNCAIKYTDARFVLSKALENKLKPIVVINKIDRENSRPHEVVNEVFDLLVQLCADDKALDFPVVYASARQGWATTDPDKKTGNMQLIFKTIIKNVPPPQAVPDAPLQMLVTSIEYSDYVGKIAVGRIFAGRITEGQPVTVIDKEGLHTLQKAMQIHQFDGLGRKQVPSAQAGDICTISGLDPIDIGSTIACADNPSQLAVVSIDEPTMSMTFRVNDGPFAGRDGKYVTSRQIGERLEKELQHNVALRVEPGQMSDEFVVSGRGLMHLGILLENMRREDYEICVGKPEVILKVIDGIHHEPIELLAVDCPIDCQSTVMSLLGERRSEIVKMDAKSGTSDFVHMEFLIPSRGLFGLNARMMNATQGKAVMHHSFEKYEPMRGSIPQRKAGVMIATATGRVTAYALDALYDRGIFFVEPGEEIYAGQVVGEHCKDNDIPVNPVRAKQMTNIRAASKDDAAQVRPARKMSLELAMEYIQADEYVEICPNSIRIRKRFLKEGDRRRAARKGQ
jgi:GTP-binding protein